MQQLQNASDPDICAGAVLEAVLEVMVTMREKTARRLDGPTLIQMRAMGVLRKRPGATLSWLSDQLALTLSATSRLVDSLVEKKFMERHVPPGNRRSISLHLTGAGMKVLQIKLRAARRELADSLKRMTPRERTDLCRSMEKLHAILEADARRQ